MKIIIIFFLLFLSITCIAQPAEQKFKWLSTREGLSHGMVTSIFQDSKGFVWFGTQNGLNRYDGYKFLVYSKNDTLSNSISGNYIRCINEDSNGNIWIGTSENGLNRFDPVLKQFQTYELNFDTIKNPNQVAIHSILEDEKHQLWIGTNSGLYTYQPNADRFEKLNFSKYKYQGSDNIKKIYEDQKQQLWLGTDDGLLCFDKDRTRLKIFKYSPSIEKSISNNDIHVIFEDYKGYILIGTTEGLNIYDPIKKTFERSYEGKKIPDLLIHNEIYAITLDKRGDFWFGTFGSGLIQYNTKNQRTEHYTNLPEDEKSLKNDYIMSLYVDNSGLLWIGTYGGGINMLETNGIKFEQIIQKKDSQNTLVSKDVYAILQDKNNLIWIGTDNGLSVYNSHKGEYVNFRNDPKNPKSLSNNSIYAIFQDSKNQIWIGTDGGGLNIYTPKPESDRNITFEHIKSSSGKEKHLISDNILCFCESQDHSIWIGTNDGMSVLDLNGNVLENFTHKNSDTTSLSNNKINCIYQDSDGVIWIATENGLNKFNPETGNFGRYYNRQQKSINTIYTIREDFQHYLWMGTDGGLYRINPERNSFRMYTKEDGLPDNVVYGIIVDDLNNLWLSTNNGISEMIGQEKTEEFSFINYNTSNWLESDAFYPSASFKSFDGTIFFGCDKGVIFFHPENVKGNNYIPPVVITDFQLFFEPVRFSKDGKSPLSKSIEHTQKIVLNAHQNVISFEFVALNFIHSEKNQYAYMLEGFDSKWNYIKEQHTATFTNLDPGNYTFRVKAANNNGIWNEQGISVQIIVTPPFYKRWWFYAIVLTSVILFVIFIIHVRTKGLAKMKNILEHMVEERTQEVQLQKEEIQSQAELLKQTNEEMNATNEELNATLEHLKSMQTQLVESEKMASLGQLTAGVAHEINNPINFISGSISPLKQDVDDILEICAMYDKFVEKNNLGDTFKEIKTLKKQIDYDFLIHEIENLLKGIKEGTERTTSIVKGLRNFSRLDEDIMKLANINEGIESTLLILNNKLKNKVEVIKDLGTIPQILCYPGKINQVFMNIINNACDAINGKGKIYIKTYQTTSQIKISIRDTGIGMSEKVRKKIFEPFFTTKDVGEGTGLGLSITFGIIENHKGKIEVNSELGKGSEFIITLPIVQDIIGNERK
jgi:ligand-binding sensor domain-containing protein/signal transduction histidine kinase